MTEINPALALQGKIIWHWLAIYICASWLRNAVGEVVSQWVLPTSISTELSTARCEPRLSKTSQGGSPKPEEGLSSSCCLLSSGSSLRWSGSPTTSWSCPAVMPGAASVVSLPWCHSRNHSLFVLQALNTLKTSKSLVFLMKTTRSREKARVLSDASLLRGYCN